MSHVIRVIRPTFVGLECHTCPCYVKISTDFKEEGFVALRLRCKEVMDEIANFEQQHAHGNASSASQLTTNPGVYTNA
jgi:hypothetical protein